MNCQFLEALYVAHMDLSAIKPEAKLYSGLIETIKTDLIPTQAVEVSPSGPIKRMAFVSQDGLRRLGYLSKRIEFILFLNDKYNMADGVIEAVNLINSSANFFNLTPYRLGFFVKAIYPTDIPSNLIAPKFIADIEGFEGFETIQPWAWKRTWKVPKTIGNNQLDISYFGSIEHGAAEMFVQKGLETEPEISKYEGYLLNTDINTCQWNEDKLFKPDDVQAFFSEAVQWHSSIKNGIEKLLGLDG